MREQIMDRVYYNALMRYYHQFKVIPLKYGSIVKSPRESVFVDCFGSKHPVSQRELRKGEKKFKNFANLMAFALILGLFASLVLKITYTAGSYGPIMEYASGIYVVFFCLLTMVDLIWFLF